jgi:hypothetical protein
MKVKKMEYKARERKRITLSTDAELVESFANG